MTITTITSRPLWMAACVVVALCAGTAAWGQEAGSVDERLQRLEAENTDLRGLVEQMRQELEALKAAREAPAAEPGLDPDAVDIDALLDTPVPPESVGTLGDPGMDPAQNPFLSFAFDYTANLGDRQPERYDADGRNRKRVLGLRSVEMVAQRGISAYADGFLVYGDHGHGFHLEEGYADINRLIPRTNIRLGKWRTAFGPYNPVHEHQVPFVSYPRTVSNFFGDHGVIGEGVEVSYLPPIGDFLELRAGMYRNLGNEAYVFAGDQGERLSTSAQVRYNRQVDPLTDLDFRLGYLNAPNEDAHDTRTGMWNAAVQWRRDRGSLFSDRVVLEWTGMDRDTGLGKLRRNAYSAMYLKQLGLYHEAGLMFDNAEFGHPGITGRARGYNAFYTWKAQEQQWFRMLYRHGTYPTGPSTNELVFQSLWSIGPHSHEFQ